MAEVNIESMSPTPLAPEEETKTPQQDVMEVGTGTALEEQSAAEDLQMQQLQEPAPVSEEEKKQIRTEEAYPAAKEQARQEEMAVLKQTNLEPQPPVVAPEYSPLGFYERYEKLRKDREGKVTAQEVQDLIKDSADKYRNTALSLNLPEGATVESRLKDLENARYAEVAVTDLDGNIMKDEDGYVKTNLITFPEGMDVDRKLIALFERGDQQTYNSGVYWLADGVSNELDTEARPDEMGRFPNKLNYTTQIDLGLNKMRRQIQSPISSFFAREETPEGGMQHYIDVLTKANPDALPARIAYMAKLQSDTNPYDFTSDIEWTRKEGLVRDTLGFLANAGIGFVQWHIDEAKGLGRAYNYIMGNPIDDTTLASANTVASTVMENVPPGQRDDAEIGSVYDRIFSGDLTPLEMRSALDVFKEANPDYDDIEISAHFNYSPDASTQIARFTTESVVTGLGFTSILKRMSTTESKAFLDFVRAETGEFFTDLDGALKAVQKVNMSPRETLAKFREQRGTKKLFSDFRQRALDYELSKSSVYRDDVAQVAITEKTAQIKALDAKLAEIGKKNDRPKLKETYLARKVQLEREVENLAKKRYIPPAYRDFFIDDTVANTGAALGYQMIYEASNYNETTSAIGSFVSAIVFASPMMYTQAGDTYEAVKQGFRKGWFSEEYKNTKIGRRAIRAMRNAPPEAVQHILESSERAAQGFDELRGLRFPDNHPDPKLAGQPVINEDALDTSFASVVGLVRLRSIAENLRKTNIDVQKDVGKLNQKYWELEKNYFRQRELVNSMAKHMDSLKYYRLSNDFDPNTESGRIVDTLIGFYDNQQAHLKDMDGTFQALENKSLNDIRSFFDGSIRGETLEQLNKGDLELSQILNVSWERFKERNLPRDMSLEQELDAQKAFFDDLAGKVNDAFEQNRQMTFEVDDVTPNNLFRSFLVSSKARARATVDAAFNSLHESDLYQDARVDLTDVVERLVKLNGEDGLFFDQRAFAEFADNYSDVESLAALKAIKGDMGVQNSRVLYAVFDESAYQALDRLENTPFADEVAKILDDADLDDGATYTEKFLVVKRELKSYFDELAMDADDATAQQIMKTWEDISPSLGVSIRTFRHLMQGMGASKNSAAWQMRDTLLNDLPDMVFDNFYGPKSERIKLEGFADDYANVRELYEKRFLNPFQNKNAAVRRLSKDGDLTQLDNKAFNRWMESTLVNEDGVFKTDLNQPGGFIYEMEQILGEPLDFSTEVGKQVKSMINSYVNRKAVQTLGGAELQRYLLKKGGKQFEGGLTPATMGKIVRKATDSDTAILDNLTRVDPVTGKALFTDKNGIPLVDAKAHRILGIDNLVLLDVIEAKNAVKQVDSQIQALSDKRLIEFKDQNSELRRGFEERKNIAKNFRNDPKGMGAAVLNRATSEGGMDDVARMRKDYIDAKIAEGVAPEKAAAYFDDSIRESVIEHVMDSIFSQEGGDIIKSTKTVDGVKQVVDEKVTSINVDKLGEMLGLRGDITDGRQAAAMKNLLGEETYDHMTMVYNTLFDPRTRTSDMNVLGTSMPMSAESILSRVTSFFRGVISLRWLISEAAIRKSRQANFELTKLMFTDPKVGEEILTMLRDKKFDLDQRTPEFIDILISQLAKNDALRRWAAEESGEEYTPMGMESIIREEEQKKSEEEKRLEEMQRGMTTAA